MSKNILAIIPARGGSKGLPKKNIRLLGGKPLIAYPIQLAKALKRKGFIYDHIVSTDSKEIAAIAKKYGGIIPFMRPRELAGDRSLIVDAMIYTVRKWEAMNKAKVHSVLLLQPAHPLTPLEDLEGSIRHYLKNQPKARCLISVCEAHNYRIGTFYYKNGKYLSQVMKNINPTKRRQDLRTTYWRNGGIYITRRDLLFNKRKAIDNNPLYYEMSRFNSADIDGIFDLKFAEFLLQYNRSRKEAL